MGTYIGTDRRGDTGQHGEIALYLELGFLGSRLREVTFIAAQHTRLHITVLCIRQTKDNDMTIAKPGWIEARQRDRKGLLATPNWEDI